jgi:hypothetical protein
MNSFILVLFAIILLIIIATILYLMVDYFKYKDSVDESIKTSTDEINNNFNLTTSNITIASKLIDKKYSTITKGITSSVNNIQTKSDIFSSNLDNFDNGLKKYFNFTDNTNSPINDRLFNHTFTSINPNLNLISKVTALSGMTINSSHSFVNSNNFRICDDSSANNCINLNVYNGNFNITPENSTNNLIINNANNKPMANFDMANNNIYLGAGDDAAPLFIHDSNIYMKNLNLINDPTNASFSYKTSASSKLDINTINNLTNTIIAAYTIEKTADNNSSNIIIKLLSYNTIVAGSKIIINIPEITNITGGGNVTASFTTNPVDYSISADRSYNFTISNTIPPKTNITITVANNFDISLAPGQKIHNIAMAIFAPPS